MLDRAKLIKLVKAQSNHLADQQANSANLAVQTWYQLAADPEFKTNLVAAKLNFSVPEWQGRLDEFVRLVSEKFHYGVVASDGSQIYPDRQMGSNYYLINTGVVSLRYNRSSSASLHSEPYFFANLEGFEGNIADYIDSKRHELEIADGLKKISTEQMGAGPLIYLCDGSLIAWHLFGKGDDLQERFMPVYFQQLDTFYQRKIPLIGYISLPNSTELINLVRAKFCNFEPSSEKFGELLEITDADLMAKILQPLQFTNWFKSNVSAAKIYPDHLRPYFAYYHTGNEIARIELPGWLMKNPELLKTCMQVVMDQALKGFGYPVALAEAHQQAVIKSSDREFFYQVINQVVKADMGKLNISRKLSQKRVMHI